MPDTPDYNAFYDAFDVATLNGALHGDLVTAVNVCVECCDRHVGSGRTALNWQGISGARRDFTFEDLQAASAQVANALAALGVGPGDRVSGLLPRVPELFMLVLGTWRLGAVYQPLFTAFGPKAIEHRLVTSGAKVVVTDPANRAKLDDLAVSRPFCASARTETRVSRRQWPRSPPRSSR